MSARNTPSQKRAEVETLRPALMRDTEAVGPSGSSQLTLFDAKRRPRLLIMLAEDGEPVLVRLDEHGNGIR